MASPLPSMSPLLSLVPSRIARSLAAGSAGAARVVERNYIVTSSNWTIFLSGFVEPVIYLFAINVGLGELVGDVAGPGGTTISYAAFAAPALLAASAMNGAVLESTFNIFFRLRYGKVYDAMLATPLTPTDIALGEIAWSQVRGLAYAVAFMAVMAVMGLIASPLALLAIPAAILMGFAFGAVGMAVVTYMRSWVDLDMVNMALLPLFLFSATFYPLDVYPRPLQLLTQLSPLYHGVALIRGLTLGVIGWEALAHIAFLLTMVVIGGVVAARRLGTRLQP